jgi:hypothetical protein
MQPLSIRYSQYGASASNAAELEELINGMGSLSIEVKASVETVISLLMTSKTYQKARYVHHGFGVELANKGGVLFSSIRDVSSSLFERLVVQCADFEDDDSDDEDITHLDVEDLDMRDGTLVIKCFTFEKIVMHGKVVAVLMRDNRTGEEVIRGEADKKQAYKSGARLCIKRFNWGLRTTEDAPDHGVIQSVRFADFRQCPRPAFNKGTIAANSVLVELTKQYPAITFEKFCGGQVGPNPHSADLWVRINAKAWNFYRLKQVMDGFYGPCVYSYRLFDYGFAYITLCCGSYDEVLVAAFRVGEALAKPSNYISN